MKTKTVQGLQYCCTVLNGANKREYQEMKVSVHVSADKSLRCMRESGDSAFVSHITSQNPKPV